MCIPAFRRLSRRKMVPKLFLFVLVNKLLSCMDSIPLCVEVQLFLRYQINSQRLLLIDYFFYSTVMGLLSVYDHEVQLNPRLGSNLRPSNYQHLNSLPLLSCGRLRVQYNHAVETLTLTLRSQNLSSLFLMSIRYLKY